MEAKTFKINIPEGFEIDKDKSTFEEIIFKRVKKELPKSWEEMENIEGYYVENSAIPEYTASRGKVTKEDRNIFPTFEEAKAAIALAQLCQLRDIYNEGWKPDWGDSTSKHCIICNGNNFRTITYATYVHFLSFKKQEVAVKFIENFRALLEKAKPLL